MNSNPLQTIASYTDAIQAYIVKGKLESEGIHASIAQEHHIWANWMISNAIGGVKIQVPTSEVKVSKQILNELDAGNFEIKEEQKLKCPKCRSIDISTNKLSWRVALLSFFAVQIPLPYNRNARKCNSCKFKWNIKSQPLKDHL